eukprot:6489255-Amphidinium_carterae.3
MVSMCGGELGSVLVFVLVAARLCCAVWSCDSRCSGCCSMICAASCIASVRMVPNNCRKDPECKLVACSDPFDIL